MPAPVATKSDDEKAARRELLTGLINFQMQAAAAPGKGARAVQLVLSLLCIAGALSLAGWLVIDGPPQPKAAAPAEGSTSTAPEEEETSGGEEGSTSALSEEAPWAFAIVALAVGAFLAAGQSISFGGDGAAKGDGGGGESPDAGNGGAGKPKGDETAPQSEPNSRASIAVSDSQGRHHEI